MAIGIGRREVVTLLGGATVAWPTFVARAQQAPKVVGLLDPGIPLLFGAFLQGMRDLGHVEGQSLRYVRRSAEGNVERIPALAKELVGLKPDVIVTAAPLPVRTLQAATSTIPIVFAALGDAITSGAVALQAAVLSLLYRVVERYACETRSADPGCESTCAFRRLDRYA